MKNHFDGGRSSSLALSLLYIIVELKSLPLIPFAAMLRVVGGAGHCSGRVEILYKGQWGTVCDDEWQLPNADVVCRQLGCGHAVSAPTSAHFGRGSGPIWLDNVECIGQESTLTHCPHNSFGDNNCGHGEDAGVICLGKWPSTPPFYFWLIFPVG